MQERDTLNTLALAGLALATLLRRTRLFVTARRRRGITATTAAGTRELRRLKGFTGASCSADEATWRAESRWSRRFDYAE